MKMNIWKNLKTTLITTACLVAFGAQAQYCIPVAGSRSNCGNGYPSASPNRVNSVTTVAGITNINNVNNACNTATGYTYYSGTGNTLTANAGTVCTLNISTVGSAPIPAGGSGNYPYRIAVWVDWNQNDTFEHVAYNPTTYTGELMFHSNVATSQCTTGACPNIAIPIPISAKNGLTRMRIRVGTRNGQAIIAPPLSSDPCLNAAYEHGEVEDYDVVVINPCTPPAAKPVTNLSYKTATINWDKRLIAMFYEYWISTSNVPPSTNGYYFTTNTSIALPDSIITSLNCDTKYYYWVRSICDTAGKAQADWEYSPWRMDSFTTQPCCDIPEVTIDNITATTAIASWTPVKSVQRYEYAVRIDTLTPQAGTITTATSVVLQGLAPSKEWYFFLRAHCSPTPLSDWGLDSFLTQPTTGLGNVGNNKGFSFEAYPNPAKDRVVLRIVNRSASSPAIVEITDVTGKVVERVTIEKDVQSVDMTGKPSGMYLLRYSDDKNNQVIKIAKE